MTDADGRAAPGSPDCDCKLGRVSGGYGLQGLDDELRRRHGDGASLRDLEEFVNVRLVEAALDASGADVAGDPTSVYTALVGEDVGVERRVGVQDQLADVGIDHERLEADFVTYQTVRRHLRDCLGVDTGRREGVESVGEARRVLERATGRCARIVTQVVRRLDRVGAVTAGAPSVTVPLRAIRVECEACGATYPLDEFLARSGCECDRREG